MEACDTFHDAMFSCSIAYPFHLMKQRSVLFHWEKVRREDPFRMGCANSLMERFPCFSMSGDERWSYLLQPPLLYIAHLVKLNSFNMTPVRVPQTKCLVSRTGNHASSLLLQHISHPYDFQTFEEVWLLLNELRHRVFTGG